MKQILLGSISQIGKHHLKNDIVCQDAAIAVQNERLTILALSDGMGSCRHAELGAQFVISYIQENAQEIYDQLVDCFNKTSLRTMNEVLSQMRLEASEYADSFNATINDLDCTLSFAILGPKYMMAASIGDSPLYIKSKDEFLHLDGNIGIEPGNISYSAYDPDLSMMDVYAGPADDIQAILIMSDGCLGFSKKDSLDDMATDFPSWFYDIIQGKLSARKAIQKLVAKGYDDCSFSYYSKM